ncbi:MAG: hypothetical protein RPS47_00525 [Colwellia sp.]
MNTHSYLEYIYHDITLNKYGNLSSAYSIAQGSIENTLFSSCPIMKQEFAHTPSITSQFLQDALKEKYFLDWRLHLYFGKWLDAKNILTPKIAEECACAASSQWCHLDKSTSLHMAIISKYLIDFIVISKKVTNPLIERKVEIYEIDTKTCKNTFEFLESSNLNTLNTKNFKQI